MPECPVEIMNKNPLIIVGGVVIIGAVLAGLWWNGQRTAAENDTAATPTPTPTASQSTSAATPSGTPTVTPTESASTQYTITYSDNGFSPRTLTVPKGATVTFVNQSDRDMWVASNPHPVHTDYSAFDSRQARDSYSFTFNESGTHGFHNHLHEADTGIITVE